MEIRAVYDIAAVVVALAALATMVASRSGRGAHVGTQAAALRGPVGGAGVAVAVVGWLVDGGPSVVLAGLTGLAALGGAAPVGVRTRGRPPQSPCVTLTTANVLVHNRRFEELARQLLDDGADILLLQEVTPAHAAVLHDLTAGNADLHLLLEPREDYAGWATLSRYPVSAQGRIDMPGWPISWAVVDHPVATIRVVNVHAAAPQTADDHSTWESQLATLADFADQSVPTVLAGDFNATTDHRSFRRLLAAGFADAFDRVGRGWGATWPAHGVAVPLLRLDHVLLDGNLEVERLETRPLVGSDHRGLHVVLRPTVGDGTPSAAPAHRHGVTA